MTGTNQTNQVSGEMHPISCNVRIRLTLNLSTYLIEIKANVELLSQSTHS